MSADPMGLGSADPADPQTMNAYAYVRNSPTSLVDPLGMMISLQQEQGWCDVADCNFQNEIDAGSGGSISDISFFGGSAGVSGVTYFETYFSTPFGECWGMDGGGDLAPCWYWNSQAGSAGSSQSGNAGPTAPQNQKCTEAQQKAAALAKQFDQVSTATGWLAFASGVGTVIAAGGEEVTFGLDTPGTVTLGSMTSYFTSVSYVTGATAATLNSFASGNTAAMWQFGASQTYGALTAGIAGKLPAIKRWADRVGDLTEQAQELASESQEPCEQ
jgi:hypothetical protein